MTFLENSISFLADLYKQLTYLAERETNIDFMDQLRADQLLWGYHPDKSIANARSTLQEIAVAIT